MPYILQNPSSHAPALRRERTRRSLLIATVLAVAVGAASPGTGSPLLAAAVLAWAWLAVLGWAPGSRRSRQREHEAPLFSRSCLVATGDQMLARCRSRSQPFSVALVELGELPELRKLFGRRVEDEIVAIVERKLRTIATSRGLAVRTAHAQFSLLLPGREAEHALLALRTALGRAGCLEHDVGGEELVLIPTVKVDAVGPEHGSIEPVYAALCGSAGDAPAPLAPTSTNYLPTEPAALPLARSQPQRPLPVFVPTMPMELRAR